MKCQTRMSQLQPPLTFAFGGLFIVNACAASVSNVFVLYILFLPGNRTKSNKVLASLAISDALVGLLLSPITAWQVINHSSLANCHADVIRAYFTVLLIGSSVLSLGIIAFDRYILLTRLMNYDIYMTKMRLYAFITFAWLFPALVPTLRWAGKYPYLSAVILIFSGPLFVLIISYVYITRSVKEKERNLRRHFTRKNEGLPTTKSSVNRSQPNVDNTKQIGGTDKAHVKLAKTVTVLIMCYLVCLTPINIWIILDLVNASHPFISDTAHQILYICAMLCGQVNSTINPVIYFFKNPDFRRYFGRLKRRRRIHAESPKVTSVA